MRIDSIDLYHVAMPLIYPWRTAYGEDAVIESVVARFESDGLVAWSESSPLAAPCYSPEWAGGIFAVLREWLAPAIVGREFDSGEELQARLAHFKGNQFAKAVLDIGWWVMRAKELNKPLHRLLGASRDAIDVGADFGIMDSIDDLLAGIAKAVEAKYKRVKLKFRPGWDLDMLRAVRQSFPNFTFHIDCNSGYRLSDMDVLGRLDDFSLAMIEQPLAYDDLLDHASLQQQINTPVCLDESICSLDRCEQAIDLGSCKWVNIKPGRVGGLTVAKQIHDTCKAAAIPCWVGGMLESAIGARVCVALATLDNFTYPADIFPSSRFYREDLGQPELVTTYDAKGSPQIAALDAPGIGAEPDPERLKRFTKAHARIVPR